MIRVYRETNLVRIEPDTHLFSLDDLIAEEVNRDGLLRITIRHTTLGIHNDDTQSWENNCAFGNWDQYVDDSNVAHGTDHNDTITNLNTLLSSP